MEHSDFRNNPKTYKVNTINIIKFKKIIIINKFKKIINIAQTICIDT